MSTETGEKIYYVLPRGATREEHWTREAMAEMCRAGQFSPDTRIFVPDRNEWVRAADAGLGLEFGPVDDGGDGGSRSLRDEFKNAREEISRDPDNADNYAAAGRLAVQLKDRETARDLFQNALKLQPFNKRIAREVQRSFSRSECAEFLYLRRDPPVWESLSELLVYPLSRGPVYSGIVVAVLFVLALVPYSGYIGVPAVFLWCLQVARTAARGDRRLPVWDRVPDNPVREIILPLAAGLVVSGGFALVLWGGGRLFAGGDGAATFDYIKNSPVLSVTLTIAALVYLPALFVRVTHSAGIIVDLLNPWTAVGAMRRMGQEYAVSAVLVLLAAAGIAGVRFVTGGVPVIGSLILAVTSAYLLPVVSFVLGRLAGRMRHLL
jgi:hypothetical protein